MTSEQAFLRAQKSIPGGVNSPVRAFRGVGGTPVFMDRAEGAHLYDIEGKKYIDYVGSFGPALVGHAHPDIVRAVQESASRGLSFGAPTEAESALAEAIIERVPSIEQIRMCNSGTEATMSAIRLARGFTKRNNILKFSGCYHGHADSLLVDAGSGGLTFGVPSSAGVPEAFAQHTLSIPYNDVEALQRAFQEYGTTLAAVIVEPIAGNMNCVLPRPEFLQALQQGCQKYGALLIFDEVMTGFRVARGGAQERLNIRPDLTTFGKVIGGGMPVGAFGGRRDIMAQLAPLGPVYQAGTLSGNPVAMAAGLASLKLTHHPDFYRDLEAKTEALVRGLKAAATSASVPLHINHSCGMLGLFFTTQTEIHNLEDVQRCDTKRFAQFFHGMLAEGIYLAPSAFEALFVGSQHTESLIEETVNAAAKVFKTL